MPCLMPNIAKELQQRIKAGGVAGLTKLKDMTSEQRHKWLAETVGEENAQWVNAKLESKLLLKYQQTGIVNWVKSITGMKPEVQRDMLARVNRMDKVLSEKDESKFLADLASQSLGASVSVTEATQITGLAKAAQEAKTNIGERRKVGQPATDTEMAYGRSLVAFNNYIADKKRAAKQQTFQEAIRSPGQVISNAAGLAKSVKASLDNSALLRQGWKLLWTNPKIWMKNAKQSFTNIGNTFGNKPVMDEIMAGIVSNPKYDRMKQAGLAIGNIEEAFPTSLPGKVPVLGKMYTASENAFTGFVYQSRADVFEKYMEMAEAAGVDISNKEELQSIGRLVNSLTGRGDLGKAERAADTFNNVFFSPRFLKSNIDALTAIPNYALNKVTGNKEGAFARKQAAINSLKIISGTAGMLMLAKAVGSAFGDDDVVDFDPRSANFGKIRIKDTRFDVTGGMGSLVVLAARLAIALKNVGARLVGMDKYAHTPATKSSISGKVSELNTGTWGGRTGEDVIFDFITGKLSPASSTVLSMFRGTDFKGDKVSIPGLLVDLTAPLPIQNAFETLKSPNAAPLLLVLIADALGIGANTYSPKKK